MEIILAIEKHDAILNFKNEINKAIKYFINNGSFDYYDEEVELNEIVLNEVPYLIKSRFAVNDEEPTEIDITLFIINLNTQEFEDTEDVSFTIDELIDFSKKIDKRNILTRKKLMKIIQ